MSNYRIGALPVEDFGSLVEIMQVQSEPLRIECPSKAQAVRLRQKFYYWRKSLRDSAYMGLEPRLTSVLEGLEATVEPPQALVFSHTAGFLREAIERALEAKVGEKKGERR